MNAHGRAYAANPTCLPTVGLRQPLSDGTQMAQAIRTAAANPNIAVHSFPWPLVTLLSPFVTLFREMREMRYLWRQSLRLSNERLSGVLTNVPQTPLHEAVRTTLTGLGCLTKQQPV